MRIALANVPYPSSPDDAVARATAAVAEAGAARADIVCFPECYIPGYRGLGKTVAPPDAAFLERAWTAVGAAAARARVTVVLGTERVVDQRDGRDGGLRISAMVFNPDGTVAGVQDKVQLDPSEKGTYTAGAGRRVFQASGATFGVAICHEGFRYPETVRHAARAGAQIVFHPHFDIATPGSYRPATFADPGNTFHEKAALCRAAENTCFFATVNCSSEGSPTTSAVVRPDGTLLCCQPYGKPGLLVADLDLSQATRSLATRLKAPRD